MLPWRRQPQQHWRIIHRNLHLNEHRGTLRETHNHLNDWQSQKWRKKRTTDLILMSYYALEQTRSVFVALKALLYAHTKSIKHSRTQLSIFAFCLLSSERRYVCVRPAGRCRNYFQAYCLLINHWVANNLNLQSVVFVCACLVLC